MKESMPRLHYVLELEYVEFIAVKKHYCNKSGQRHMNT